MSDDNGGPRVWNRADVLKILQFVDSVYGDVGRNRVMWLMNFVETFPHRTDAPPEPNVDAALPQAKGGLARAQSLTAERRSEIASNAGKARWSPEKRAAQSERAKAMHAARKAGA